jgi:hypothetical protein
LDELTQGGTVNRVREESRDSVVREWAGAIGEHNSACTFAPGKVLRSGGDAPVGFDAASSLPRGRTKNTQQREEFDTLNSFKQSNSNMSCNQPPFVIKKGFEDRIPRSWLGWAPTNDRWLVVSNSPETFDPADSSGQVQVLYKTNDAHDIVIPGGGKLYLRVFLWHANGGSGLSDKRYVHVVCKPVTGSLQGIAESKVESQIVGVNSDLSVPGICLAKAHLFGTVDNNWGSSTSSGQIILNAHELEPGELVAAVHELRIDGTAGNKVQVRVVATDTEGSVGDGSETPAEADAHIRGSWPYTDVLVEGASVEGAASVPKYSFPLAQTGEADRDAFAKRTADTYGKDNKGLYGADLTYRVPVTNSSGDIRYCIAAIQPTVQHKLWGAARDIKNSSDKGVPKITWPQTGATRECVLPAENLIIPVSSTTLDFPIAFGGAAELPASLYLEFSPTPSDLSDI